MTALSFEDALAAIRDGADYSLSGRRLTVNGITLAFLTDEEFDAVWDAMDEVDGDDSMISLNAEPSDAAIYNTPPYVPDGRGENDRSL